MPVTDQELTLIAETDMARAMSKDVPNMESFLDFFLRSLSKKDRVLAARYILARMKAIDAYLATEKARTETLKQGNLEF